MSDDPDRDAIEARAAMLRELKARLTEATARKVNPKGTLSQFVPRVLVDGEGRPINLDA